MINDTVDIVLATFNGEEFLPQLLNSIVSQDYVNWQLYIADDLSEDRTCEILTEYKNKSVNINVSFNDKNKGVINNFEYLLKKTRSKYLMFCDQDDLWFPDKISKTINKLLELEKSVKTGTPLLVYSDAIIIDKNDNIVNDSFWHCAKINPQRNKINNLLLRNIVTGCTMGLNRELLEMATPFPIGIKMFDWWLALVASVFGEMSYIEVPLLKYRLHQNNTVGIKNKSIYTFIRKLFKGSFDPNLFHKNINELINQAKQFYNKYFHVLDNKTKEMLIDFINIYSYSFIKKRVILQKYSLWTNRLLDNTELIIRI